MPVRPLAIAKKALRERGFRREPWTTSSRALHRPASRVVDNDGGWSSRPFFRPRLPPPVLARWSSGPPRAPVSHAAETAPHFSRVEILALLRRGGFHVEMASRFALISPSIHHIAWSSAAGRVLGSSLDAARRRFGVRFHSIANLQLAQCCQATTRGRAGIGARESDGGEILRSRVELYFRGASDLPDARSVCPVGLAQERREGESAMQPRREWRAGKMGG